MMRLSLIVAVIFAFLIAAQKATAHDIGSMSVECTFSTDGGYTVDATIDPEHLVGSALLTIATPRLAERFLAESTFSFGSVRDHPQFIGVSQSPSLSGGALRTVLHFGGRIPSGSQSFTFSNRLALGEYYLKLRNERDSEAVGQWLGAGQTSAPFALMETAAGASRLQIVGRYLVLGFTHIIPEGLDHILFVLGLFLLSMKLKPILMQVTAFTVAHSITLGLSMYGLVTLSPRIVEPMIALSIAYVAIENIFLREYKPWRTAIVFCFGLLHGLGFAGVLRELGLPRSEFVPALISFNVGVEAGQLSVIALAFFTVGLWFGKKPWYRSRITVPASALIALVGLYWTFERLLG